MLNKEKNFVSAVIYVHNAERRIETFLNMMIGIMEENFEHSEIICVNDCSDDGSADVIKTLSEKAETTSISIVNMSFFHGLELAMDAGRDLAIGDFVFEFDNTIFDFDSEMIMKIYQYSLTGYDIVSASPNKKKKLSSRFFYEVFDRFAENSYELTTESFRILSRRVINRISSMNKTIPYRKAIYAGSGLKTANLKYEVKNAGRNYVDSKEKRYRSSLAVDTLILFTGFGYRFSFWMTSAMMLVSVFIFIKQFVEKYISSSSF